jgi:hypothetical protein
LTPPWAFLHFTHTWTARTASFSSAPAGPDSVPTDPIRMGSPLPAGAGGAPGVGTDVAGGELAVPPAAAEREVAVMLPPAAET